MQVASTETISSSSFVSGRRDDRDRPGDVDDTWFEYTQIPAGSPGRAHQRSDRSGATMEGELLTRPPWLGDLQHSRAPPPDVANADVILRGTQRGDVLAEWRRR